MHATVFAGSGCKENLAAYLLLIGTNSPLLYPRSSTASEPLKGPICPVCALLANVTSMHNIHKQFTSVYLSSSSVTNQDIIAQSVPQLCNNDGLRIPYIGQINNHVVPRAQHEQASQGPSGSLTPPPTCGLQKLSKTVYHLYKISNIGFIRQYILNVKSKVMDTTSEPRKIMARSFGRILIK